MNTVENLMLLAKAGEEIDEGRRMVAQGGAKITGAMMVINRINGGASQTLTVCHKKALEASTMAGRIVMVADDAEKLLRGYLIKARE